MNPKRRRSQRPKLLSNTRPPSSNKALPTLSSRATRTLIRKHHNLQKQLSSALSTSNQPLATSLEAQIHNLGGIQKYQTASLLGQSSKRGGDSSKFLIEWLSPILSPPPKTPSPTKVKLLEVGALKVDNACSRSTLFDVERIDLHSQHPAIIEQDFMQRPIPPAENIQHEGFDLISLSLVINYVGDAAGRGDMLRRIGSFLRVDDQARSQILPALFLVLPRPCIDNSRYLNEERLEQMMAAEGYELRKRKVSDKLVYYLWRFSRERINAQRFGKTEVRSGRGRNNFAIVMQ